MKSPDGITIAGCTVLLLLLLVSCSGDEEVEQVERRIAVKAMIITRCDQEVVKTYTGSLEGQKQAVICAKLAEAVEKMNVHEGQRVRADDILLTLDKYGPSSQYNRMLSIYRNSEKNVRKMEFLYKEGAVSESQYDAARTEYEVNKASFEAVERLVEIRSPISGVVTSIDVSEGDLVQIGKKLATVAATDRLRVKFGVNQEDIRFFKSGAEVIIGSDVIDDRMVGTVVSVAGSADPVTRTFQVEALVDNTAGLFRPGMFVRITYIKDRFDDVIAVPRKTVLTLGERQTVFVIDGGLAQKRTVTLGPELGGQVIVESGLAPGDTLVTLGQDYLEDGTKVNITAFNEHEK